jgi:hypothetical protein
VFDRVQVRAQNEDLDYTVLQVDVGTDGVPFLPLAAGPVSSDVRDNKNLRVIGHPMGASLRTGEAQIEDYADGIFKLKSVAVSGNSGSPLVDVASGKVLGLYNSSEWDKSRVDISNGRVEHYGTAISSAAILASLRQVYAIPASGSLRAVQFAAPLEAPQNVADILPESTSRPLGILANSQAALDTFFGQYWGTPNEKSALQEYIAIQDKKTLGYRAVSALLGTLLRTSLATALIPQTFETPTAEIEEILAAVHSEGWLAGSAAALAGIKTARGEWTAEQCGKAVPRGADFVALCGLESKGGLSIITAHKQFLKLIEDNPNLPETEIETELGLALQDVRNLLAWDLTLSDATRTDMLHILDTVVAKSHLASTAYSAEGLRVLLAAAPALVLRGGMKNTIPNLPRPLPAAPTVAGK